MSVTDLPSVLLLDLDNTILRFDARQPNFWRFAVQRHLTRQTARATVGLATSGRK